MAWKGVRKRFSVFHDNLQMTTNQVDEGESHYTGVIKSLNKHYYSSDSVSDKFFPVTLSSNFVISFYYSTESCLTPSFSIARLPPFY